MKSGIAIVGMACRYPDASSPDELWANVLAGRRAFRRIPPERLRVEDYFAADAQAEDKIYSSEGAFIEGYEFDRVRFRIAGSTFRSADLAHWLALDTAARALSDAGFADGERLSRESAGVFLGNTLTGEFSRANALRLRWPYVRRVAEAELIEQGMPADERRDFLARFEEAYKRPFPAVGAETLAGGLSNTIAGRICNHFDLKGGGYTVDGACASSLLAVTSACSALVAGDLDAALAGGVDLSIDPFELVGFAKAGALARDEMRVFDRHSAGFWPGEGCGFVVLMRLEDALAQSRRVYAVVKGWGVSSDGSAGITRPEAEGQMLALERAYRRAGYGVETVTYFEGHGTGTSVGDSTELKALSAARRRADASAPAAVIGSVKANIGHTKAAAGIAGLLKTVMALHTQMLPPTTGCREPSAELSGAEPALRVLRKGERWPQELPLRAGVSAMGFGGINTHVTLEGAGGARRRTVSTRESALLASAQDAELFLLAAPDREGLLGRITRLLGFASRLSMAELTDLAAALEGTLVEEARTDAHRWRAAIVAPTPAELAARLQTLRGRVADTFIDTSVDAPCVIKLDASEGIFLGAGAGVARVGLLFPGQAAPVYLSGGALSRRFEFVEDLYALARLPAAGDTRATALAQPSIVTASLAGLRVLDRLGVEASVAVGHSLGELTALCWAGAMDERELLRLASLRARAMTEGCGVDGKMVSIKASPAEVRAALNGDRVVISGFNSPSQIVVAGESAAVDKFAARVKARGHGVVGLNVSHAFHSPLMSDAAVLLATGLRDEEFRRLKGKVISTITGTTIPAEEDLRELLCRQLTAPVRFVEAAMAAAAEVDLFVEVGPGEILGHLVSEFVDKPCVSLAAGGESLRGLLKAAGAVFASGACVDPSVLFAGRIAKPFSLDWQPRFFVNPCELAPAPEDETLRDAGDSDDFERRAGFERSNDFESGARRDPAAVEARADALESPADAANETALEIVRRLVAERAELPLCAVEDEHTLLGDLHLNSITVSQMVIEAARSLGLPPPVAPTEYAHATVAEVAAALEDSDANGVGVTVEQHPSGVEAWIRSFTVELVEQPLNGSHELTGDGVWHVFAPDSHPLASRLREAFAHCGSGGTVVCLPPEADERCVGLLLEGARASAADESAGRFVLVQHGRGAAAFARTLKMEMPRANVCVVNVPPLHERAAEWVLAEACAADGYAEAHYDEAGVRRTPVLRLVPSEGTCVASREVRCESPLGPEDLLLVTGGGKGIAAECALSLARETGARLLLLGRSRPEEDAELSANLKRIEAAGISFRYFAADVTDAAAVREAVACVEAELGGVTAILHGAGVNTPRLLSALDEETFLRTLAPKVSGARNVLAAVDAERLRLFVTFGSIIARTGMRGEADYAVANEWLADLTADWQSAHPRCRCLAVEWSVWSGVGMGQRLGRVDALVQQGITPITADEGIRVFRQLLNHRSLPTAVVVTGRFGEPQTLKVERPALPLLRFLEECRAYYPGVELIVEARLSEETDPYLRDHVFQGEQLFPAVLGLEAMAQAAGALAGKSVPPSFEEVRFERPVVVPRGASTLIRVAALARATGEVEVALRSEQTAFQVDHFRAVCRFDETRADALFANEETHSTNETSDSPSYLEAIAYPATIDADPLRPESPSALADLLSTELPRVALEPARDLYGGLLFHEGRFRRLRGYLRLSSNACVAEIERDGKAIWFGRYMPGKLLLADPGRRDATIHSIQACVPGAVILPVGVRRLEVAPRQTTGDCVVNALERAFDGQTFTYDVEVKGPDGILWERWSGLRLRVIDGAAFQGPWAAPLVGPYVERRVRELIPSFAVSVAVERDASVGERRLRSDRSIRRLLGRNVKLTRRPDGKPELRLDGTPELSSRQHVSVSHCHDLTLAVVGGRTLACDVEAVETRDISMWRDLLGPEPFALASTVARLSGESLDTAATRVWTARECLKKAGAPDAAPLTHGSVEGDGWVRFESPPYLILTYAAEMTGSEKQLIFTVLAGDAPRDEENKDDGLRAPLVTSSRGALRCEDAGL
ncbi:MAG TPA: SDR family NAD(P)-dependent oxidoreductase [Pyrinomonadaceae bacterium]|nr:SDR family NAD(P)-dependent oxidoreductase [Pyrinomonadaceae bacterium]